MGLPLVGVKAEVQGLSGYQAAIRTINTANDSAGASVNHLSNIFDFALGGVVSNVISGVVNMAAQGTAAIVGFVGTSIDVARKGQAATRQLDAVLKSTGGTTEAAVVSQGHWANSTDLSGKALTKLQKQIDSANKTLNNQITRTELMGKTTKGAAVSIQMTKDKLAGLNAELTKGTAVQKVWVNGGAQVPQVTHMTRQAYIDLGTQLSNTTKYSKTTALSAENILLTFTKIGAKTFPTATRAVADMATAMHMDLSAAALVVGKALQDPVAGVTSLQREGVKLTAAQKNLVRQFVATGQAAKAQDIILKELATEFGGSAEAAATPWDLLQNKIENFQEVVGGALTPVFDGIASVVGNLADAVLPQLTNFLDTVVGPALSKATAVFGQMFDEILRGDDPIKALNSALMQMGISPDQITSIDNIATGIANFVKGIPDAVKSVSDFANGLSQIGIGGVVAIGAIALLGGVIVTSAIATGIGAAGGALAAAAGSAITFAGGLVIAMLPIILMGAAVAIVIVAFTHLNDVFVPLFASGGKFGAFGDQVRDGFQKAITPAVELAKALDDVIKNSAEIAKNVTGDKPATPGATIGVQSDGTANSGGVYDMLHDQTGKVPGTAPTADVQAKIVPPTPTDVTASATGISAALQTAIPDLNINKQVTTGVSTATDAGKTTASTEAPALGKSIVTGMAAGVASGSGELSNAVVSAVMASIGAGKKAADAHSPSRVFAQLGKWMMQGLSMGINDNARLPSVATQSAVASTIMAAIQPQAMPITTSNSTNNNSTVNNNASTVYNLGVSPYQSQGNQAGQLLQAFGS